MDSYRLIILGQGSAAFAAAIRANQMGVKTAMVGGNATMGTVIGGTCVNVGCMPSKRLISVGTMFYNGIDNAYEGIEYGTGKLNFRKIIQEKDRLVRKFRKEKYVDVLKNLEHVTYHPVRGKFVSRNAVEAGDETFYAEKILIATGARATVPTIRGVDKTDYLTNEEALSLTELPRSLCIVGGRALWLEFAHMYAQFGTKVTVLQRGERILPGYEPEISSALTEYLQEIGVKIYTSVKIDHISKKGKAGKSITFSAEGISRELVCDRILFCSREETQHRVPGPRESWRKS
jgi:mercuric reductase